MNTVKIRRKKLLINAEGCAIMVAKVAEKVIITKMAFTWYTKCAIVNALKNKGAVSAAP